MAQGKRNRKKSSSGGTIDCIYKGKCTLGHYGTDSCGNRKCSKYKKDVGGRKK